jgi:uncharacterized protein (DUF58 family)
MTLRDALLRGKRRPRNLGSGSPTSYRGDGYEFVELRAYVPGDDVRRIDWAASARSGDMQTRVVLEDVALTLAAIVDDSASMRVGRTRPLLDAAYEAAESWLLTAKGEDRCMLVGGEFVTPAALQRQPHAVYAGLREGGAGAFDTGRALLTARAALPPGTALLAASDWYDLDESHHRLLAQLGARYDCTALIARDPWYDGLPLAGMVRLRGAEGGHVRAFIGRRERELYRKAVQDRERALLATFASANWRTGILTEEDGFASIAEAFGLHAMEVHPR